MIYSLGDKSLLFKKISIQLQNDFDATLRISDKYDLTLAKCIYRYLHEMYINLYSDSDNICEDAEDIAKAYLSYARLYKDITLVQPGVELPPLNKRIYNRNIIVDSEVSSINEITKYNIAKWPIADNIIQYIIADSVITPQSSLEDIAAMQKLLSNIPAINYDYRPGLWDLEFSEICYQIQKRMRDGNVKDFTTSSAVGDIDNLNIICTGFCDVYVERYLRSKNEVRSTSYGNH